MSIDKKKAILYRMVADNHICPFGIKSLDLLKRKGFEVEDNHLSSREETDKFKEKHDAKTTPQTFIEGKRIGGFDSLVEHFGEKTLKQEGTTYQPIIAIFATTFLMAVSATYALTDGFAIVKLIELFIAFSMCVLAIQKFQDLFSFTNQFITYDLIGKKYVCYAYFYPFVEGLAGVSMISGFLTIIVAPATLVVATIGAISVVKAVYIDKRDIKCACVGGGSNVPLGFISLTENLMMIGMAIWMLAR